MRILNDCAPKNSALGNQHFFTGPGGISLKNIEIAKGVIQGFSKGLMVFKGSQEVPKRLRGHSRGLRDVFGLQRHFNKSQRVHWEFQGFSTIK